MTASEKLKALDVSARIEYVVNMTAAQYRAWKALPQIVAVVEAQEELNRVMPRSRALRLEYTKAIKQMRVALAALDEALT